jgi:hypothetical protein
MLRSLRLGAILLASASALLVGSTSGSARGELAHPATSTRKFATVMGTSVSWNNSTMCGATRARWNVPSGALVSSQAAKYRGTDNSQMGTSPVRAGIEGMGGTRTHSMLATGTEWVTHATMQYKSNDGAAVCDNDAPPFNASRLSFGYPGATQINMAALYSYLYVNDGIDYIAYQRSKPPSDQLSWVRSLRNAGKVGDTPYDDPGRLMADWAWAWPAPRTFQQVNKTLVTAAECTGSGRYTVCQPTVSGTSTFYRLFDNYGRPHFYKMGNLANYSTVQTSDGTGVVCSDFLYRLQYWSGKMELQYIPPTQGRLIPHAAAYQGVKAFRDKVYALCQEEVSTTTLAIGQFVNLLTFGIGGCSRSKNSICAGAADQAARCIVAWNRSCGEQSPHYTTIIGDPDYVMRSLTPDQLGGWDPWSADFSVWAWDVDQPVSYNTSGSVQYGCWTDK